MRKLFVISTVGAFGCLSTYGAIDLKESKFTQVVNDVQIISTADNSKHAASVDGLFQMPDVLRTGPASRAELVAADNTITRVGANTIFSFDAANRSIHLEQGSLLFNSPKGKGGGSIHTAAATAAVLGTTIIVVTTPDGGFKILTLEGTAEVKFLKGLTQRIESGHLIYVLPGGIPGPVVAFRLDSQIAGSKLVSGFGKPLPSLGKIQAQVTKQVHQIASGRATDTGLYAGNQATVNTMQVINPVQVTDGSKDASHNIQDIISNPGGTQSGNSTSPGSFPVSAPGTIAQQPDGSYLTPDGFLFRSDSVANGGPGETYAAGPAFATVSDAVISGSTLDSSRIFTGGITVNLPVLSSFSALTTGFFARNITISTGSIDLSPFASLDIPNVVFFASQNLNIVNNLTFTPLQNELVLFSGGRLSISPGVSVVANANDFDIDSVTSLALDTVTVQNSGGDVFFGSFGPISINNSTLTSAASGGTVALGPFGTEGNGSGISLNNTVINADNVEINSGGSLSLTGTTPARGAINSRDFVSLSSTTTLDLGVNISTDSETGSINIQGGTGQATIHPGVQFTAQTLNVSSGGDVLVDSIAIPTVNTISVTAGGQSTVQNSDLSGVPALNISAHTIVLANVALPNSGTTVFTVANGLLAPNPNTDQTVIPGDLNFQHGVTYHGVLTSGLGFTVR